MLRACSGFVRINDDTEFSVLNRKWGLIWLVSAASLASFSLDCCASSFFSLRELFQILSGSVTAKIVLRTMRTWARSGVGFQIADRLKIMPENCFAVS